MSVTRSEADEIAVTTGIPELDGILAGGFPPNHLYLIQGNPGSGKTTLGLQFLLEGATRGESGLYVTLSESKAELIGVAKSHGWSLDKIGIFELSPDEDSLDPDTQSTMFEPAELELSLTTKAVLAEVERLKPTRVIFDSLSEMRLLAQSPLRYRRQILALKQFFIGRQSTILLLDDNTSDVRDLQLESIAHGVLSLEQLAPEYGAERRRLRVSKMRGVQYRGGYHDFVIRRGGLEVFPRLVAAEHSTVSSREQLKSDLVELDHLLGGGIERGNSVLLMGPAGSGKSSTAVLYASAAAKRGERAALFIFDESREMLLSRSAGLGMDLVAPLDSGHLTIDQIDPAELSPGEFAYRVCQAAQGQDGKSPAKVIVIDTLNGYLNAMPEERFLTTQLHELLTFLGRQGVVTFLVVAQHGLIGNTMDSPVDASYLADSVILFRYFEAGGEVRQAISVMKKRSGAHERSIREFRMKEGGIRVGEPLQGFHGVLGGTPTYSGSDKMLLNSDNP
jgi:circadian clock protein KaiC